MIGKLMKIKRNYLKVGLTLTALALVPLAYPALAGEQVPLKGVEAGGITGVSFDFPFGTTLSTAEGEATQLGHYTITGIVVVDVTSGGGTGRFEGATGSWVLDSHFAFVFGGPELTDPYVAVLEGTISTPGANKK